MSDPTASRAQVLAFRWRRHQLGERPRRGEVHLLDGGIQETGPDGAAWALALRGAGSVADDLFLAWTLRGAPHAYRRRDAAAIAVATAPYDQDDAAKRMFDAVTPLRKAGIEPLEALRTVADHLRALASSPISKGDASTALTELLPPPYLRACRPCQATHVYEMPFRLAPLQAGLELEPGTSPPVLRRIPKLRPPRFGHLAGDAEPRFDVIRNHLRFYGPATVAHVATFLDAPQSVVRAHWPADAVPVAVRGADGPRAAVRFVLAADLDDLLGEHPSEGRVVLLGTHDPYVQLRDRELLVPEADRRKALWPTIGRPGAIARDGELVGTWRPRTARGALGLEVAHWIRPTKAHRAAVADAAAALAAHRGLEPGAIVDA